MRSRRSPAPSTARCIRQTAAHPYVANRSGAAPGKWAILALRLGFGDPRRAGRLAPREPGRDPPLRPRDLFVHRHRGLSRSCSGGWVTPIPRCSSSTTPSCARCGRRTEALRSETVGDSFLVARSTRRPMHSPRQLPHGADAIAAHVWPDDAPIRVRIGVHTGMAFPHEGDYIVLALHQASRVVAVGKRRVRARVRRGRGRRR